MNKHVHSDNNNALTYLKLSIGGALNNVITEGTPEKLYGVTLDSLQKIFDEHNIHFSVSGFKDFNTIDNIIRFKIIYNHNHLFLTLRIYDGRLYIEKDNE